MTEPIWKIEDPTTAEFYGYAIVIEHTGGADRDNGGHLLGQIQVVILDEYGSLDDGDLKRHTAMADLAARIAQFLNAT